MTRAACGHVETQIPQPLHLPDAKKSFPRRMRPTTRYPRETGARSMPATSDTGLLNPRRPSAKRSNEASAFGLARAMISTAVVGRKPGWIAIQFDGMSIPASPRMLYPLRARMRAGMSVAVPSSPGKNQEPHFVPARVAIKIVGRCCPHGIRMAARITGQGAVKPCVGKTSARCEAPPNAKCESGALERECPELNDPMRTAHFFSSDFSLSQYATRRELPVPLITNR